MADIEFSHRPFTHPSRCQTRVVTTLLIDNQPIPFLNSVVLCRRIQSQSSSSSAMPSVKRKYSSASGDDLHDSESSSRKSRRQLEAAEVREQESTSITDHAIPLQVTPQVSSAKANDETASSQPQCVFHDVLLIWAYNRIQVPSLNLKI